MTDKSRRILIVDDDASMRMALSETLEACGYEVESADNGSEALRKFQSQAFEVVVTDMRMPRMGGMDVLKGVKKVSPQTPVILITAYGTVSTAVEAMKEGASEFIMKPFSLDDLQGVVKNVLATGAAGPEEGVLSAASMPPEVDIISQAGNIKALFALMKNIAKSKSSVLIQGESGTGKELFARYIYRHSNRKNRPFIAINCAAIPHHLLESEMFGYEKGAFTGAVQRKPGRFELADGGTLLLDEIGEMDIQLQAKLLRVLQESEVDRLGGREPISVDVRIIATTNSELKKGIEEKKFREDLFYRLNVIPIHIPPLRERDGDVVILSDFFLKKYSQINEKKKPNISPEAMSILKAYHWPGNVRELEHVIERSVLICDEEVILPEHLYLDGPIRTLPEEPGAERQVSPDLEVKGESREPITLKEMEKSMIFDALDRVNGNRTKASKILGISVRTMRNKLQEYEAEGEAIPCDL
jgi:DNA-binding NtrC family response regulator